MRVLVLGGNGFIGSHVVDRLLAEGHSVRVFDRTPEKFRKPLPDVDYRLATFDDVASLAEALEGIDVVYHLISTTVPSTSNKDPVFDVETNLVGTLRLLNLMREGGVPRIVLLSSGGTVYGIPDDSPIPESHEVRPICSYGVVKAAIENYLKMYHHLYGLEYVVLRASNPYGERQGHSGVQGVIGTFIHKIATGDTIEIWGDGSVVRDFIYVGDLAQLCVKAGGSETVGIYNAGCGVGYSINEIVDVLAETTGKKILPHYRSGRTYDVPSVILDISRANYDFDWVPEVSITAGIASSWAWMSNL